MIIVILVISALLVALRFDPYLNDFILGHPVGKAAVEHATYIDQAIEVGLFVCGAVLIDRFLRRYYWHGYVKRTRGRDTPRLLLDLFTVLTIVLAVTICLWSQDALTVAGIAATATLAAAAIGVALQADIQDVFSGLAMNYEDTCAIGDWVTVHSQDLKEPVFGRVSGLSWRSTFLTLENGCRVSIPNHLFTSNPVVNHSRPRGAKQLDIDIKVDLRIPSDRVLDMLLGEAFKAVRKPGLARNPEPEVLMTGLTEEAGIYCVRFWYYPDELTPAPAKSVVLQALQDVIIQNKLPSPVTQIEITPPPDVDFTLGQEEVLDGIGRASLFRNALNEEQRTELASKCRPKEFPRGSVVMRQGEAAETMYVVLEGAISIRIGNEATAQEEVAISATGDVVGEMSLMTGTPRTATVTALTRLRAVEITKDTIEDLLKSTPELFERFSTVLAQRQLENAAFANRKLDKHAVETDIMAMMKKLFSRAFGLS
jgi:CRP-like cAMP-binding protein